MHRQTIKTLSGIFSEFKITKSELKIIQCLLHGYSNAVIAAHLKITEGTVKVALSSIYKKTRVKSRTEFITKFHSKFEAAHCEAIYGPKLALLQEQLSKSRTEAEIRAAFPAALHPAKVKPDSLLANHMLQALLNALKFQTIS